MKRSYVVHPGLTPTVEKARAIDAFIKDILEVYHRHGMALDIDDGDLVVDELNDYNENITNNAVIGISLQDAK